ncbi:MAG TPA: hypothetical protein VHT53_11135 [Candidatus Elarobacter sp.]|jgi:Spy/CpxP family protein refolding chaperone|nr:hypothetical protein [Candidatus Elarobacter sp.]
MRKLLRTVSAALAGFAVASAIGAGVVVTNAAAGVGPVALAQTGGSSGAQRGQRFAKMLMSIRPPLSDAQKDRIRKMREQMRAQYQNQPPPSDPDARRARFRAFMDKIRGVLTPAQQRDFDAKMAQMRNRQGQH